PDFSGAVQGVSAAIQNMLLAAYDKGIGTCWMTAPIRAGMDGDIQKRYAPDKGNFIAAITMGYPAISPRAPKRKEGRYTII
ncbi:MAG: nitroreductase family protein, partial [Firmicutes bacterium]|nr:nitroreductase family protein [Bacillota bacterium]